MREKFTMFIFKLECHQWSSMASQCWHHHPIRTNLKRLSLEVGIQVVFSWLWISREPWWLERKWQRLNAVWKWRWSASFPHGHPVSTFVLHWVDTMWHQSIKKIKLEWLYNMSSATYFFPPFFKKVFAELVFLANIRGAVVRYSKRDQK